MTADAVVRRHVVVQVPVEAAFDGADRERHPSAVE